MANINFNVEEFLNETNAPVSVLLKSDISAKVYCDGEFCASLSANSPITYNCVKGPHTFTFASTRYPETRKEVSGDYTKSGMHVVVSLKNEVSEKSKNKKEKRVRLLIIVVLILVLLFAIGFVGHQIAKPRIKIDSKKHIETTISPKACVKQFSIKSNKHNLVVGTCHPWTKAFIDGESLNVIIEQNDTGKERCDTIVVKARKKKAMLIISQLPIASYLTLEKQINFDQTMNEDYRLPVFTDAFEISAESDANWCQVKTNGNSFITITCDDNLDDYARLCHIDVTADTLHQVVLVRQTGVDKSKTQEEFLIDYYENNYSGQKKDGIPHGIGTLKYENGDVYEGQWKDGNRDGYGKLACANGDEFEGQWKDDKPNGKGKAKSANNNEGIYDGQFRAGDFDGQGTMKYYSGDIYQGEWKEGERSGYGKYKYSNGDLYDGHWENHKKNGFGKYKWANGNTYEGQWENNMINGRGTLTTVQGEVFEGQWENNNFVGDEVLHSKANGLFK